MNLISPVAQQSAVPFRNSGMTLTKNKSASTATRVVAYFCPPADVVFTNPKSNAITRSCSPFSRKSLRKCGSSFPTSNDTQLTPRRRWQVIHDVMLSLDFRGLNLTKKDLWRHWLCRQLQLVPPVLQILLLLPRCDLFILTQPSESSRLLSRNSGIRAHATKNATLSMV